MQEGLSRKTKKERMMVLAEKEHFGSADVSNTERNSFVFVPSVTEQFVFTRKKGEKKPGSLILPELTHYRVGFFVSKRYVHPDILLFSSLLKERVRGGRSARRNHTSSTKKN